MLVRGLLAASVVFAIVVAAPAVRADEDDASTQLFAESVALMQEQRFAEAIPKLERAQRMDPGTGTQFNLGICYAKTGRLGSAWRSFLAVERLARATGNRHRELAARAKLDELLWAVPRLRLQTQEQAGLAIELDGAVVATEDWAFVPLDPGPHLLVASAPAKVSWATTVEPRVGGETLDIIVPVLADANAAAQPATVAAGGGGGRRTLGFVLGGVGIAGVATAVVTGILVLGSKSTADDHCSNHPCDQTGRDAVARIDTLVPINAVAWVLGIAGVGAGAFFVLTSKNGRAKAAIAPRFSAGGAGVGVSADFD